LRLTNLRKEAAVRSHEEMVNAGVRKCAVHFRTDHEKPKYFLGLSEKLRRTMKEESFSINERWELWLY
jgi:hypothetical protein